MDKTEVVGREIPSELLQPIVLEWVLEYGLTFPLYGNETVRHDISGSVRPLLSSTELPHQKILAEMVGVSKKTIQKIMNGETRTVKFELVDKILTACGKTDAWWNELESYY